MVFCKAFQGPLASTQSRLSSRLPRPAFSGVRISCRPTQTRRQQQSSLCVRASNPVGDAAKYLADAAKQIFSPTNTGDEPDWSGTGSGFSGSVVHHEESAARLRALYNAVRGARENITGCTDPDAINFDPAAVVDDGTCNYVAETTEETGLTEDLKSYVTNTVSRVWNNNFKGDTTEPQDYKSTGYSYSGRVSKRDISRLLQYEKVVKKAMEEAEKVESK